MAKKKHTPLNLPKQGPIQREAFTQQVLHAIESGESLHLDKSQSLTLLKELSLVIDQLSDLERNIFDSLYRKTDPLQSEELTLPTPQQQKGARKSQAVSKIKIKSRSQAEEETARPRGTSIMTIGKANKRPKKAGSHIKIVRKSPFA